MTKATRHTPGPWGIRQKESIEGNALLITASQDGGRTFGGHIVTSMADPARYNGCRNFSPEEQIANAKLMAAAPDLLAALKLCYALIRRDGTRPDIVEGIDLHNRADEAARLAIATAEAA